MFTARRRTGRKRALRNRSRPQVRRAEPRHDASRRRPLRQREPRTPSGAKRARRGAGGAGTGAADQLGSDDSNVPGAAARRSGVCAAAGGSDVSHLDSWIGGQRSAGSRADGAEHSRPNRGNSRRHGGWVYDRRADGQRRLARSGVCRGPRLRRGSDSSAAFVQVRLARASRDDGKPVDCRAGSHVDGHLRETAGCAGHGESRTRDVAEPAVGDRQANPRQPQGPVARSDRCGQRRAHRWRQQKSADDCAVARADGQFLRRRGLRSTTRSLTRFAALAPAPPAL